MPITPKEILEQIGRDFNSTEHQIIYDLMQDIDYKLQSEFTGKGNVCFIFDKDIERVHPNRRAKLLNEIIRMYQEVGWKFKIEDNRYFTIDQK